MMLQPPNAKHGVYPARGLGDGSEVVKVSVFDTSTTLAIDIAHEYGLGTTAEP